MPFLRVECWNVEVAANSASKDMVKTGEICCKGHECLPVAKTIKERNMEQQEREKQEAKERESRFAAMGKEKDEVNGGGSGSIGTI
jgi:hypothetical protein